MNKIISFFEKIAPMVLRYAMSFVILWFSFQQFMNASAWTAYVPDSAVAMSHLSALNLVYFNALFELVFGICLTFGWYTRVSALLLALHLLDIMYVVGYGEIGIRDFGLAMGTLVIAMNGPDALCLMQKNRNISRTSEDTIPQPVNQPIAQNFQSVKKII